MTIARLRAREALRHPALQAFLGEAFPEGCPAMPGGFDRDLAYFVRLIDDPDVAIFVGEEGGKLAGLAMMMVPPAHMGSWPAMFEHFHNTGSAKLRRALVDAALDFAKRRGYVKVRAINATGRPASVWARMFRSFGKVQKVGDVMEVDTG